MLSIVIPTLNAEDGLPRTLASIAPGIESGLVTQVIVADGGSQDDTHDIAIREGAQLVDTPRGRGTQLAAGAEVATMPWLLFLHADTVLQDGWQSDVRAHMTSSPDHAAVFRFRLDDDAKRARILEWLVRLRCAVFAIPYGDQGLLISRALYDAIDGYKPIPLMEDVDIVRRITRARLAYMSTPAVTSAARYQKYGYIIRAARNLVCVSLFYVRVPPAFIRKLYG